MIVKGEISEQSIPTGSSNKSETIHILRLEFIFQVNGKISQFQYAFKINNDEEYRVWELSNVLEWYPIAELFFSIGHNFGSNPMNQDSNIINDWIKKCNAYRGDSVSPVME